MDITIPYLVISNNPIKIYIEGARVNKACLYFNDDLVSVVEKKIGPAREEIKFLKDEFLHCELLKDVSVTVLLYLEPSDKYPTVTWDENKNNRLTGDYVFDGTYRVKLINGKLKFEN